MTEIRQYADGQGELDLASFQDVVAVIMEYMAKKFEEGDQGGRPVSVVKKHRVFGHRSSISRDSKSMEDLERDADMVASNWSHTKKSGLAQRMSSIRKALHLPARRSPKTD